VNLRFKSSRPRNNSEPKDSEKESSKQSKNDQPKTHRKFLFSTEKKTKSKGTKESNEGPNSNQRSSNLSSNELDKISEKEEEEKLEENFENLPESVKKKCKKKYSISESDIENHISLIYTIGKFLMKEAFPATGARRKEKSTPYASEELIEFAKSVIKIPEKSTKKIFKHTEFGGKGGFGSVVVAKSIDLDRKVAIKKLPHTGKKTRQNNFCEVAFLATCDQPNIVQFLEAYEVESELWIVMEYLEGGTLSLAAKAHKFSDRHVAYVAKEILSALKYLHEKNYVHRDLKSSNVMMSISGEIKLIDFGLCKEFSDGPVIKMLGSPYWIPPEMINGEPHSYKADIWSFGVCLLELILSSPPFYESTFKCMYQVATVGLEDQIPDSVEPDCRDFLTKCLQVDQDNRLSARRLLKHPWVARQNLKAGINEILKKYSYHKV